MEFRPPPDNDHEAIFQIWVALIGTNGDGIFARLKRLENRGRNNWLVIKDLALLLVAIGSMAAAFWAVFVVM